jgi:hypothetical protein
MPCERAFLEYVLRSAGGRYPYQIGVLPISMYKVRHLSTKDRTNFRRLTALTVNPDDFMVTAEEEMAIPPLSIEEVLDPAHRRRGVAPTLRRAATDPCGCR